MKRTTNTANQRGFTLIELLLAMAFFSSVLMIATLLLTQTLNIYNRGMTVKQMNQVGRTLVEDMIRAGNSGETIGIALDDGNKARCLNIDKTIYAWNIVDSSNSTGYKNGGYYKYDNAVSGKPINFVKLVNQDEDCATLGPEIVSDAASPVIGDSVRVYDMNVSKIPGTGLVHITMLLGTFDTPGSDYNVFKNGDNFECKPSGVGNFCAKANFDTVLYVPNGGFSN